MNPKATLHCRHSENAFNIKNISQYYAIESRIYNSVFSQDKNRYIRGPLWFTNIMVFDYDFDEKHFPNIIDYENKLKDSLNKLQQLLGTPHYIIYNKTNFTQEQINRYFTKIENNQITINLPKKYGCQVVYELKESLKSQYPEQIKLYNLVRQKINILTDGDINFKGHMFKNFYNKDLFNIIEYNHYNEIDIFELAYKLGIYDQDTIDKIKSLSPFRLLEEKNQLPTYFKIYNTKLYNFYINLNSWKSKNTKDKIDNIYYNYKSSSRNETLFRYLNNLSTEDIVNLTYNQIINLPIYEQCLIKEPLSENEVNCIKKSILNYRERTGFVLEAKEINNQVFKINQNLLNIDFFKENQNKFEQAFKNINLKHIPCKYENLNFYFISYNNNYDDQKLANLFLNFGVVDILSNIRNLFIPDLVEWVNKKLFNNKYKLYELYNIFKSSIYLIHFKLYHSIRVIKNHKPNYITKKELRQKIIKTWGFNYKGHIAGFSIYYNKLKNAKLLKNDGSPYPISFYQNYFHIRNLDAWKLVCLIKSFIEYKNIHQKINSGITHRIIKNFDIGDSGIFYFFFKENLFLIFKPPDGNNQIKPLSLSPDNKKEGVIIFMNHLIKDTETSGLNPKKSFIISLGAVHYNDKNDSQDEFYHLCNWKLIYPNFTANSTYHIHKITDEELQCYGLHPLDFFAKFYDFIIKNNYFDVLVAFNIPFDLNILMSNLLNLSQNTKESSEQIEKIDELITLLRQCGNEKRKFYVYDCMIYDRIFHFEVNYRKPKHNLEDVGLRYGIPIDEFAHNSLADAKRTLQIYKNQLQELKQNNITINAHLEQRFVKQFERNKDRWHKRNTYENINYFAKDMVAATF